IVTMAMLTTMAMPPMLRAALADLPMDEAEKKRVEREKLDEKGFVPNLERLLLAVDAGPVGRMAARLAGLLAGGHGMPVTILKLDADLRETADNDAKKNSEANRDRDGDDTKRQEHDFAGTSSDADSVQKNVAGAQ